MKKTIATLLAVLMILGLAACGGSTDTAPYSKDVEIAQSKTISYYEANKTLTDWWEVMALVAAGVDVKKEGYTLPELDGAEILTSQSPTALRKPFSRSIQSAKIRAHILRRATLSRRLRRSNRQTGSSGSIQTSRFTR